MAKPLKFPRVNPMSRKRERGRPTEWATQDRIGRYYRPSNTREIEINEKIECLAPACDNLRADRSQYCKKHARRLRDAGDPICRLPKATELRHWEQQLEDGIASLPEPSRKKLELTIRSAVRAKLQKPEGWSAKYHDLHSRLPTKAKAAIVLANATKQGADLRSLVVRAKVLYLWAGQRYNGMPQNHERFIQTQIGKLAIRKARLAHTQKVVLQENDPSTIFYTASGPVQGKIMTQSSKTTYKNLSGTVARQVGVWVLQAMVEHELDQNWFGGNE